MADHLYYTGSGVEARLVNEENEQSNKHYHARGMTWAQRPVTG